MAGSKKGEHRGNAKKRPPGHETPNQIMREAAGRKKSGKKHVHGPTVQTVEARIMVARVINGDDGRVRNMTPKEIMLDNMWTFMQGAKDYEEMWKIAASVQPPTPDSIKACELAEREIERLRLLAGNAAFQVMPVIHPRLSAIAVADNTGANPDNIVQTLLDEIDKREREKPTQIEHLPTVKRIA